MCTEYALQLSPEPIWTWREKEKFWSIVEPYLQQLLSKEIPIPPSDIDFSLMKAESKDDELCCYRLLRNEMWFGKYSMAIANYKAMKTFFTKESKGCEDVSDLAELKALFMERSLERSNIKWIEKHTQSLEGATNLSDCPNEDYSCPSR